MATHLNHTARYAVLAALHLAQEPDRRCTAASLAGALTLPRNYLGKVLHTMAHAGLLESMRGPSGGFRLARAPHDITLADITAPFVSEDPDAAWWQQAADPSTSFLKSTTLQMLIETQSAENSTGGPHGSARHNP